MMRTLGDRIRAALAARGINQTELERRAGFSRGYVSRLLDGKRGGKRTSHTAVSAIAIALNVRPEWLSTGDEPMDAEGTLSIPLPGLRFPNGAMAARIAREGGIAEPAIQDVLAEPLEIDKDPPVLWWLDRMRACALLLEQGGALDPRTQKPPPPRPSTKTPKTPKTPRSRT